VRVLLFAEGLTALPGMDFGMAHVVPWRERRPARAHEGSGGRRAARKRLRSALVVVEIVASVVPLVSAVCYARVAPIQGRIPAFKQRRLLRCERRCR